MYAQQIRRMGRTQKATAEVEAEKFAKEIGYDFVAIKKSFFYYAEFEDDELVDIVRCPYCSEVQVCFGEYGDPELEENTCTQCQKDYQTEPF